MKSKVGLMVFCFLFVLIMYGGTLEVIKDFVVDSSSYLEFKSRVAQYPTIDILLRKYLTMSGAGQIGVAMIENSVHDLDDNDIYYVAYQTMLSRPGVVTKMNELQRLPAIVYTPVIPTLLKNEPKYLITTQLSGQLRQLNAERGIAAVLYIPMHDPEHHLIGWMAIIWVEHEPLPTAEKVHYLIQTLSPVMTQVGKLVSTQGAN